MKPVSNDIHLCAACVANMRTYSQRMRVCAESSTGLGPLVTMCESMKINTRVEWQLRQFTNWRRQRPLHETSEERSP